jgi:hypothetical protein
LPKHLTSIDEYIKYLIWVKREWKLLKFNWIRTWNKSENFNRSIRIRNKTKWHEAYNFIVSFKLIFMWYELYQQLLFILNNEKRRMLIIIILVSHQMLENILLIDIVNNCIFIF